MANIKDVAKYIISLSDENSSRAVTPLKLQKILYYVQGLSMKINGREIFHEELEAWDHGPVNGEIYTAYKHYRYLPIEKDVEFQMNNLNLSPEDINIIQKVWNDYGDIDGKILEELTHQEDPWINAYEKGKNVIISKEAIHDYFNNEYLQ